MTPYGQLVVTIDLSKEEARKLEETLTSSRRFALTKILDFGHALMVHADDIEVAEVGGNVQFLKVKGTS